MRSGLIFFSTPPKQTSLALIGSLHCISSYCTRHLWTPLYLVGRFMRFAGVTLWLLTSGMSGVSLDFSRNPSRGKAHSVRVGSLSCDSKMSSRDRKFSSIPTPGCTGRYDCVSIFYWSKVDEYYRSKRVNKLYNENLSCSVYNSSSSSSLFCRQEPLANHSAAVASRPEQSNPHDSIQNNPRPPS